MFSASFRSCKRHSHVRPFGSLVLLFIDDVGTHVSRRIPKGIVVRDVEGPETNASRIAGGFRHCGVAVPILEIAVVLMQLRCRASPCLHAVAITN